MNEAERRLEHLQAIDQMIKVLTDQREIIDTVVMGYTRLAKDSENCTSVHMRKAGSDMSAIGICRWMETNHLETHREDSEIDD